MSWFKQVMLLSFFALMSSCLHARETKATEEAKAEAKSPEQKEKAEEKAKTPQRAETITTSKTTKQMFKPDGVKKMQVALSAKTVDIDESGQLDNSTQESLRKYQKDQGLPATGLPDYETLRRLGLKPEEVFHRDTPSERLGVQ